MKLGRGKVVSHSLKHSILGVRPLEKNELLRLAEKRPTLAPPIQRLRDSHHNVARCIALGLRDLDIKERTGFSRSRIVALKADPAFMQLVAEYRDLVNESFKENVDEFMDLMASNMLVAERMIADRLEEADEEGVKVPMKDLLAISRDGADRTGRGKKTTNVNFNIDFAASLERAIKRSEGSKTIEGVARTLPPQQVRAVVTASAPAPEGLRRRL